jgi:hypothetical protein
MKFNAIFWNSIWYFDIKGLPYDFLIPYYSPPEAVEEATFPALSLFMQNIRLSYIKGKDADCIKLSFDECEPKFLIDEIIKSNFLTNISNEIFFINFSKFKKYFF